MPTRAQVTPLALAVLELLHERPRHPYDMQQVMRTRHTDRLVKLKAGSLYHTVERLERLGLVEVSETERSGRRPERRVYAITPDGRTLYREYVTDMLATVAEEYPEYPLAISLAHAFEGETVRAELQHRRDELQQQITELSEANDRLERMELPRRYWLDIDYLRTMKRAELAWTDRLIGELASQRIDWPAPGTKESQ
ncbi:PadR family transcriptional regulator [Tenggerimyces flavus]|uniref:PadR family transcriptional regulator n=1 Tax=Tenggerimyces flavus TaxID=1708749 RepID=A0ABV7YBV8_9ACTN|nr:helix-turn-helix transcriptional regulator [Tenggerimyces flavus]MBM7783537.1 DNA-binding PadR family transcriptional regulator [Tenggerimyces flavus]